MMPKIGMSSYCLVEHLYQHNMDILQVMEWAKENGAEHLELVPFGFTLLGDDKLCQQVKDKAEELDLPLSNYAILADVLKWDEGERKAEIQRIKTHVDVAAQLGIPLMRHDISSFRRPMETNTTVNFEREFPMMVEAATEVADYAAKYGITTTVENHGFFVNGSDRVIRLVEAVNRPNFKMCLDTGNLLCVDEQPETSIKKCMPYVGMIHMKDFYIRKKEQLPGIGGLFDCDAGNWFATLGGKMLRGSIFGQGDIDVFSVIRDIKESGYDGYISLEFEGMEESRQASLTSLNTIKNIFAQLA